MKKKKTFGLFGTNKRKPARKGDKRIKEYDDYYEEEEYEDQEYVPEDDEGAYYEDGDYIEEDYEYADEAQYADEEGYEDDAEHSDDAYYENEPEYMDEAGNGEYAQGYEEDVEYTSAQGWVGVNAWSYPSLPTDENGYPYYTISENTSFDGLSVQGGKVVIDTTNGPVYVKVNQLSPSRVNVLPNDTGALPRTISPFVGALNDRFCGSPS